LENLEKENEYILSLFFSVDVIKEHGLIKSHFSFHFNKYDGYFGLNISLSDSGRV
jgi:hypothetical protein